MGLYKRCTHKKGKEQTDCADPWWGQCANNGTNHRINLEKWIGHAITGKQQAAIVYKKFEIAIKDGKWPPKADAPAPAPEHGITFDAFSELYITEHVKFHGLKNEEARVTYIGGYFKERRLKSITTSDLRSWILSLRQPYVPEGRKLLMTRQETTVDRYVERLRHMVNWAIQNRHMPKECNPFKDWDTQKILIAPTHEDNRRDVRATEDDLDKILCVAPKRITDLVHLATDTGIRRGELIKVSIADIDARPGYIRLPAKITKGTKKTKKTRWVPIATRRVAAIIMRYLLDGAGQKKAPECRLLSKLDGTPMPSWRKAWETARRKAGVPNLRWHDLRHEFGSRLSESRVPMRQIMLMMGHSVFETTMRYDTQNLSEMHANAQVLDTYTEGYDPNAPTDDRGAGGTGFPLASTKNTRIAKKRRSGLRLVDGAA